MLENFAQVFLLTEFHCTIFFFISYFKRDSTFPNVTCKVSTSLFSSVFPTGLFKTYKLNKFVKKKIVTFYVVFY